MCTVLNSVGLCVCVNLTAPYVCMDCTVRVRVHVCGVWKKARHGQAGVLKSTNLCFTIVLKNIQCDHALSGERYNSHGKAGIAIYVPSLVQALNTSKEYLVWGLDRESTSIEGRYKRERSHRK